MRLTKPIATRFAGIACFVLILGLGHRVPAQNVFDSPQGDERSRIVGSSLDLAHWLDRQYEKIYATAPVESVNDELFLRRTSLDLSGAIPSVAFAREFLADESSNKRAALVDTMLEDNRAPYRHRERSATNLARVWRHAIVPQSAQGVAAGRMLEPWLKQQFLQNVAYDAVARKIVLAPQTQMGQPDPIQKPEESDAGASAFYAAVGANPADSATALSRIFLGVRLGCAQCHDHPFTAWKKHDFWGLAAFLGGTEKTEGGARIVSITGERGGDYVGKFPWNGDATLPEGKSAREVFAEWLTSPENPQFAATAVNRVWQHLCGRGLYAQVDDLDQATPQERELLDILAKLFIESKHNVRWLVAGVCKSKFYGRASVGDLDAIGTTGEDAPRDYHAPITQRPLKVFSPDQVFDSLEQSLALPVTRADGSPRFNGQRDQMVNKWSEAVGSRPEQFRAGVPQALMMMNGALTAGGSDLNESRTLRAIIEAPFFGDKEKLDTMFLATLTRKPTEKERQFMIDFLAQAEDDAARRQAYSEIFWALLNSPEFVLSP